MTFIFFHGSFGSAQGNWFPSLSKYLKDLGQEVVIPQFPVDDFNLLKEEDTPKQSLSTWLDYFKISVLPSLNNKKLCFVGHSIGSVFILHLVDRFNLKLDSALFVSPFLRVLNGRWQSQKVNNTFYSESFDWVKMRKAIPVSYVVHSDNDPYIPMENFDSFAEKMGSKKISIKGAGHCGDTFSKFPLLEELCKNRISVDK